MAEWLLSTTPILNQFGAAFNATARANTPSSAPSTGGMSAEDRAFYNHVSDEQARQADRDYKLKKEQAERDYKLAKQSAKTAQQRLEIDRWYNEQQVKIAQDRLAQEAQIEQTRLAENARQFNERLGFDREVQAQNLGLNQARLGYDVLGMQANLRGPQDYFAAANLARGVAAQPGTATFLNALRDNSKLVGFGAQAGSPDAVSVNSLSAKLGGPQIIPGTGTAAATGAQDTDALHRQIQQIGAAGAHKLGAGSLERLTDTEMKLLLGGLGTAGPDGKAFDTATFLDQYARSRIGQGYGNLRAA